MVAAGGVYQQRERASLLQVLLKPTLTTGRADPEDSHPVMNKWGGAWAIPSQVRVVLAIPGQPIHESQTFPTSTLPQSCK
jgi:hypothetical protein